MNVGIPPGKAAIIRWMDEVVESLRSGRSSKLFTEDIQAGEYVIGIEDFLKNIQDVGWSKAEIERYARQLEQACELANSDPHPEYLSEGRIDDFVEEFMSAAGYNNRP